jgi:DNA polymerase III subunit gamma/tau
VGSALYRRYRPENFAELIGQTQVTDPLRQALVSDRTHHAYLFSGPRGCGKTTSARILARCLNCHQGPTDTPCGECPSCVELSRDGGGSLDVVEIDAASHNGVEDARELRERAVFAPSRDRYKIFILDEAHMVTQQGFNALLKIVEEPPEHIKFIFATTEPEKVLTTIRSRTHHYPFRLVAPAELIAYLQSVLDTEGLGVEDGVLSLVVRAGGGSVRDSLSLLDQLMAGSTGDSLTLHDARTLLGYTSTQVLDDVTVAIAEHRAADLFTHIDGVIHSGGDPRRFVEDFLSHVRDLIVAGAAGAGDSSLFPGVPSHEVSRLQEQAGLFSPQQLTKMADTASHTLSQMAGVTSPKLHLEVMMAKILTLVAGGGPVAPSATPAPAPNAAQASSVTTPAASPPSPPSAPSSPPASPLPSTTPPAKTSQPEVSASEETVAEESVEPMSPWNVEALAAKWPAVIESLAEAKRSLWAALSETLPVALDGDVVTIGFAKRQDAEILRKPQGPGSPLPNADLLRDAIYQHTGYRVKFTVGELPEGARPQVVESPESTWPVVASPGSETGDDTPSPEPEPVDNADVVDDAPSAEAQESPDTPATGTVLGQRGEPAIRTILGGELIGEEVLEADSPGDSDV